jgi:hypothetical protein
MNKRKPLPPHCLVVREYDELRSLILAFAKGAYQLMCIIGGPGLSKTETVTRTLREVLGPNGWGLIKGKHTELDLYQRLHHYRSVPVVLDDLDDLLRSAANVMLLKSVADTSPVKRVEWGSNHAAFANGLPKSFESVSRICMICNDWEKVSRNISAVYDRGLVILFQPSALEVHRELARGGWFTDEEVFQFIGTNLFLVTEPSFRFYLMAADHKKAGLDWRDLVLRTMESDANPKLILVARLLADPRYDAGPRPEAARVEAFKTMGGGSRAAYHRHQAELLARRGAIDPGEVPAIKLPPPKPDLHYLAQQERRQQIEQMGAADDADRDEPAANTGIANDADPIQHLRRKLQVAIDKEDYKLAAELRDQIRRIKEDPPPADEARDQGTPS